MHITTPKVLLILRLIKESEQFCIQLEAISHTKN